MSRRKGLMLVLSSPSGAGKTSIAKKILELDKNIKMSISYTTRPKRRKNMVQQRTCKLARRKATCT